MESVFPSRRFAWVVLACIFLLYLGVSFAPVIFDDNEGLYADTVREMHARGDWLVPVSNGFPRVQKPPLVYWTMLLSTSLLGQNEFALRLPNTLATWGWIVATYLIMRRIGGERFGLGAAMALASMLGVWIFTHLIQPEPFLACSISLAFWCLVEARFDERRSKGWYFLFWLFLALGTMSKGLHGALWPLGVAVLLACFGPGWRPYLRPILQLRGVLLFLLITVPWYAYMAARFPHFLYAQLVNEQWGAAVNTRFPVDARQLPLLQFYGQHLLFWMPWTLLAPGALYATVLLRKRPDTGASVFSPAERDALQLLATWLALTLVSVAFSTRQDYYSMSCWGVAAAFLVFPWTLRQLPVRAVPRAFLVVPCLLVACAGAAALVITLAAGPHLAALGDATAAPIAQRDTFMDALGGISPALWGRLLALLGWFGAAMLAAGAGAATLAWKFRPQAGLLVLAAGMAVPVILATRGFVVMSPYFSLAESARAIEQDLAGDPGEIVACEALPNTASSLLYYLPARVHWVNAPFDNQYAQKVLGLGHDYYWDDTGLESAWASSQRLYFIVEEDRLPYWRARLSPAPRVVKRSGTRYVLCNR
jgi:4-amino-4-deoxy-L-arabinose transferase-like glycosyltransferase